MQTHMYPPLDLRASCQSKITGLHFYNGTREPGGNKDLAWCPIFGQLKPSDIAVGIGCSAPVPIVDFIIPSVNDLADARATHYGRIEISLRKNSLLSPASKQNRRLSQAQ